MSLVDQTRKIPGVSTVESAVSAVEGAVAAVGGALIGTVTGLVSNQRDLPIAAYDKLNATDIVAKLRSVSQRELSVIAAYEAKHQNRVTIIDRIAALKGVEPWHGYDDQNVSEITAALAKRGEKTAQSVTSYERDHKDRSGVIEAAAAHATAG